MPTDARLFDGDVLRAGHAPLNWEDFCEEVQRRLPRRVPSLARDMTLRDLSQGDKLMRASLLGAFYELGKQMPDDMLRSLETVGEAFEWCNRRRSADVVRSKSAGPNETATLKMRPVVPQDAERLYVGVVDPAHSFRWRYRGTTPTPRQFGEDLFDGSTFVQFALERIADGALLGLLQAYQVRLDTGTCYFAYTRSSQTAAPISEATAGLFLFLSYLFRTFDFRKLYAEIPGFNWPAFASGEGAFFTVEGVLSDHDYHDGRFWDLRVVAVTRERWRSIEDAWSETLR